jgi:hypothetical protein
VSNVIAANTPGNPSGDQSDVLFHATVRPLIEDGREGGESSNFVPTITPHADINPQ